MEATSRVETISSNIHMIFKEFSKSKRSISLITNANETVKCIVDSYKGDGTFQIKIQDKNKLALIKPDSTYSIGCGGKDGEIYSFISKCLTDGAVVATLSIPSEVKVVEQRIHKRINTLNMKNPYLELVSTDSGLAPIYILNDLSNGGLSFLVPAHLESTIKIGDKISIKRMGNQVFAEPLEGIIIHKNPLSSGSTSSVRVGVRFSVTANI